MPGHCSRAVVEVTPPTHAHQQSGADHRISTRPLSRLVPRPNPSPSLTFRSRADVLTHITKRVLRERIPLHIGTEGVGAVGVANRYAALATKRFVLR